ncbi:MAG: MarR family transcriptional regulator [Alphaproteobacteria bacterium]|nr:MarR family transcriptional regulator [Alphaproteobacteria bacterium]
MEIRLNACQALDVWRLALTRVVRDLHPDLSARQMAILLNVYLGPAPHTVRGLARDLGIAKPAVTRALDTLEKAKLARRAPDPRDKRSILIERTVGGAAYLGDFAGFLADAGEEIATHLSTTTFG